MAYSRDRLVREDPMVIMSGGGRSNNSGIWQETSSSRLNVNTRGGRNLFGSPIQSSRVIRRSTDIRRDGGGGGYHGTPGIATPRNSNLYGTPLMSVQENPFSGIRRRGAGGGRLRNNNTLLPNWYPRTALRDITGVVNAIERRRTRLREDDSHLSSNAQPQESNVLGSNLSDTGAHLEPEFIMVTPHLKAAAVKAHMTPVQHLPKNLLGTCTADESDFLTPQKQLLNSIDQVGKAVLEELLKMKRTPTAKKAERQKKVRTLMAMR
ncbi:hypothetical protein MKW94_017360 [Papaver nudicaule]|uniref:Uncharacterized protein n=1 Tax=Papaver nudicaule TaxID=74823 RepID=A0AA41SGK0_PAPNU|nr:hypothetical protein [Papaver nudicaule]